MKNAINLIITLAICTVFTFSNSVNAGASRIMGDINGDDKVGLQEAIYALQVAARIKVEVEQKIKTT